MSNNDQLAELHRSIGSLISKVEAVAEMRPELVGIREDLGNLAATVAASTKDAEHMNQIQEMKLNQMSEAVANMQTHFETSLKELDADLRATISACKKIDARVKTLDNYRKYAMGLVGAAIVLGVVLGLLEPTKAAWLLRLVGL